MPPGVWSLVRDLLLGILVGVFSGLFGVGGGIILVPILVLLMHIEQKNAQATSLVVVALSAISGSVTYGLGNSVEWIAAPFIVLGGLGGTWLGTWLVRRIQDRWLQFGFALVLLAVAARLIWLGVSGAAGDVLSLDPLVAAGYALAGFAMGLLSALLGVGGGVIVIPILVTVFGFPQQLAAGTSLVAMVPLGLLGAARLSKGGFTNWAQGVRIGLGAIVGAVGGAQLALSIEQGPLQVAFAVVLVYAAVQMIIKAVRK